ncbi:hypothetical protein LPW11_00395 [Geomonas sp. RF6]|uniref:hypothetical protein n=1 Tax=Geomonas sp. RF6 TaxID=2897342 RepID=UPI001E4374DD|nr:hypothetical protein [Geomonas sp. RF6]UFS70666.1 hypothetical protein LPW11_00395 [Geomonas sp. RF6]
MKRKMILNVILLTGCLCAGNAAAQPPHQAHGLEPGGMSGGGMHRMMEDTHHKLGMAYRQSMEIFAQTLKSEVRRTGKVDKEFAETAVEEMRRSFGLMKKHHDEHKRGIPADVRQQMDEHIKTMEGRLSSLRQHLDLLEKEVKAQTPDPKKVIAEADEVVKGCEMMKMNMEKGK